MSILLWVSEVYTSLLHSTHTIVVHTGIHFGAEKPLCIPGVQSSTQTVNGLVSEFFQCILSESRTRFEHLQKPVLTDLLSRGTAAPETDTCGVTTDAKGFSGTSRLRPFKGNSNIVTKGD